MTAAVLSMASEREAVVARAGEIIRSGGVIVYPTDTLYGLGADPTIVAAVRRLFAIKGRQEHQPILLLLAAPDAVDRWAAFVPPAARRLMARFWPGPLTVVLRARPDVLPELTGGTGTIGLRVPGSETTRQLIAAVGGALTGTSANRSGSPAPATAAEAAASLGSDVDLVLDNGPAALSVPSTIVDLSGTALRVLREGAIPANML